MPPQFHYHADSQQHVDPEVNSISFAYLLHTLYNNGAKDSQLPEDLAQWTVKFIMGFNPRQIRYAGGVFSSILDVISKTFPPSIAVELLATALLRIDLTGSILTSHHLPLVKQAYYSENIEQVLPLVRKSIVFYPGMRGQTETRPLCDLRLPSSAYISIESGLTARVTSAEVMEYDLVCGLIHLANQDWASASAAFERVCTFPTRDFGCSNIMVQAYNRWILVGLLLVGKLRPVTDLGTITPSVQRAFQTVGKPYLALAKAFEKGASAGGAKELKSEAEGSTPWVDDGNEGLVREVLVHYQRHHILRLREVYTKISLEDIRLLTHSAETGAPLGTAGDVENLLNTMIASGMLSGVIEKPSNGPAHLTFLSEGDGLSETQVAAEIERCAGTIRHLAPIIQATNERLGTSRDYVKHLAKEQRNNKDGYSSVPAREPLDLGFDSTIEDEDLMTGVQGTGT